MANKYRQTAINTVNGEWHFSDEVINSFLTKIRSAEEKNQKFVKLECENKNLIQYIQIDNIITIIEITGEEDDVWQIK